MFVRECNVMSNGRMTVDDKLEMIRKCSQPGVVLEGEENLRRAGVRAEIGTWTQVQNMPNS
jgi:hypothetical protein